MLSLWIIITAIIAGIALDYILSPIILMWLDYQVVISSGLAFVLTILLIKLLNLPNIAAQQLWKWRQARKNSNYQHIISKLTRALSLVMLQDTSQARRILPNTNATELKPLITLINLSATTDAASRSHLLAQAANYAELSLYSCCQLLEQSLYHHDYEAATSFLAEIKKLGASHNLIYRYQYALAFSKGDWLECLNIAPNLPLSSQELAQLWRSASATPGLKDKEKMRFLENAKLVEQAHNTI